MIESLTRECEKIVGLKIKNRCSSEQLSDAVLRLHTLYFVVLDKVFELKELRFDKLT